MTHNNKIIAWAKETGKKLRISTYDMTSEEGWVPLVYANNDADALKLGEPVTSSAAAELRCQQLENACAAIAKATGEKK